MINGNVDGTLDRVCLSVLSMFEKHSSFGANVILEKTFISILPMSFSQSRVQKNRSYNHTVSIYNPEQARAPTSFELQK